MAIIEWSDDYSVGVAALDDDHKKLIDIINKVEEAERKGIGVQSVLQELEIYTQTHFQREEERMAAADYPELAAHIESHKRFIEWLVIIKRTLNVDPEAHFHLAGTVKDYLKNWLTNHILSVDMEYKGYLS